MRKVITALCVLASVELTSDAVAQQWTEYRPADARFRVEMPDGTEMEIPPNHVYEIPSGHDAWVVGDEPAVLVEFDFERF